MPVNMLGLEHIYWGMPLVLYPYLSGLVAGSFIVATLSKVFGIKKFEPLAKIGVALTLVFLIIAALAPLAEATMRSRWWELFTRDHIPYSPLGFFIIIWVLYVILVLIELYVIFRPDNIKLAKYAQGWRRSWHKLLAFGSRDTSAKAMHRDHTVLVVLSAIGILLAFIFHGYVGFVFGALKARPLWSNPLMMPMFIMSAIVSGVALMILAYEIIEKGLGSGKIDPEIVDGLMNLMMWLIFVDLFLDIVDLVNSGVSAYTSLPVYQGFSKLFFFPNGPLAVSYWVIQLGFLVVAMLMCFVPKMRRSTFWSSIAALLVMVSVFAMRFNTVIGGEMQPKVSQGLVRYQLPWFGVDSVQVAVGLFAIALTLICLVLLLLPWNPEWVDAWTRRGRGAAGEELAEDDVIAPS